MPPFRSVRFRKPKYFKIQVSFIPSLSSFRPPFKFPTDILPGRRGFGGGIQREDGLMGYLILEAGERNGRSSLQGHHFRRTEGSWRNFSRRIKTSNFSSGVWSFSLSISIPPRALGAVESLHIKHSPFRPLELLLFYATPLLLLLLRRRQPTE